MVPSLFTSAARAICGENFRQQNLYGCTVLLTTRFMFVLLAIIGAVFLPMGILFIVLSGMYPEYELVYRGGGVSRSRCQLNSTCEFDIYIATKLPAPVQVYYALTNFYQNHRKYQNSRSSSQLRGNDITDYDDLGSCYPAISLGDSHKSKNVYSPCGLIALSKFNDTFAVETPAGKALAIGTKDMGWLADRVLVHNPRKKSGIVIQDDYTDPLFLDWMRVAAFPDFRKLYGVINTPMQGFYRLSIDNQFPTDDFGGKKSVIFGHATAIGGNQTWLGVAFVITGSICLVCAALLLLAACIFPRRSSDMGHLVK